MKAYKDQRQMGLDIFHPFDIYFAKKEKSINQLLLWHKSSSKKTSKQKKKPSKRKPSPLTIITVTISSSIYINTHFDTLAYDLREYMGLNNIFTWTCTHIRKGGGGGSLVLKLITTPISFHSKFTCMCIYDIQTNQSMYAHKQRDK